MKVDCTASDTDKHELDINFLLYHNGKLFTAADDGKIKVWSPDLKQLGEIQAHPCSVFCLAANNDILYSCSNEGTVKSWNITDLTPQQTIIQDENTEFWRVAYSNDVLFTGDDKGFVKLFKNHKLYGQFNIAEPVKDMVVDGYVVFTVKDLDLVITDVKQEGEKLQFGTKNTFMGRSPVTLAGDKVCFSSRDARDVIIHEKSSEKQFQEVTQIKGAHDLVINALAGGNWDGKIVLFSGGWDKTVKKWILDNGTVTPDGSCDVGIVINSLVVADKGIVYVGGADGHLLRISV